MATFTKVTAEQTEKRGRGRPKGSKNKTSNDTQRAFVWTCEGCGKLFRSYIRAIAVQCTDCGKAMKTKDKDGIIQ